MISLVLICLIAAIIICVYTGHEFGKTGIVSNKITFQVIFVGIIINCIYAYLRSDLWMIMSIIWYVIILFILGYVFWKAGAFGGGLVKLFTGMGALLPYPVTLDYVNSNFSIGSEYSLLVSIILFILPFLLYVFYLLGLSTNYMNVEPNTEPETTTFDENYDNSFKTETGLFDGFDSNFPKTESSVYDDIQLPFESNTQKKPLVFISYYPDEYSRDKIIAHAVYGELESNGIKCWIAPNDILPGQDKDDAIVDAIDECVVMIVIFSDNVNSSDYIKKQVLLAADGRLNIITFRIEDVLPKKGLKLQLNRLHWLDAFTEPLDDHIQKLVKSVEVLIEMKAE